MLLTRALPSMPGHVALPANASVAETSNGPVAAAVDEATANGRIAEAVAYHTLPPMLSPLVT